MIIYNNLKIYNVQTKKQLAYLLGNVEVCDIKKQTYFIDNTKAFIIDNKRLVEAPAKVIKKMQRKILFDLRTLEIPKNIFSGIKKRSYVDNVLEHSGRNYFMKIDLSKFFPHITRDKVYKFYLNKLNAAPDVANILTNLSTIDVDRLDDKDYTQKQKDNLKEAKQFIENKKIKPHNHLMTGSRISPMLSYLVNEEMFKEIQDFCDNNKIKFTLYVDDMAFSSSKKIKTYHKQKVYNIIQKYGYVVNKEKTKIIDINSWKMITGGIIETDGKVKAPRALELKIKKYNDEFKKNNFTNIQVLYGCLLAAMLIEDEYSKKNDTESKKYKKLYNVVYTKYKEMHDKGLFKKKKK